MEKELSVSKHTKTTAEISSWMADGEIQRIIKIRMYFDGDKEEEVWITGAELEKINELVKEDK